jgi:hypothetical protein
MIPVIQIVGLVGLQAYSFSPYLSMSNFNIQLGIKNLTSGWYLEKGEIPTIFCFSFVGEC